MNRNPVKNWSITFPQSGEVEREEFVDTFPPCTKAICSMERHEDGNPHLHLGIALKKPLTKAKLLKWIQAKYPDDYKRIDVQATRSIECWSDYISKEDPDAYRVEIMDKDRIDRMFRKTLEDLNETEGSFLFRCSEHQEDQRMREARLLEHARDKMKRQFMDTELGEEERYNLWCGEHWKM